MLCPHGCGVTFDRQGAQLTRGPITNFTNGEHDTMYFRCPACGGIVIELVVVSQDTDGQFLQTQHLIWPRSGRAAPPEVPESLRSDFAEAASILDLSPQASAALSRRIVQQVLTDHLNATGGDLEKQIDSVVNGLPTHVGGQLHALRMVGNFAAHPIKDTQTGAVVPVEPGEAEWTLGTVESLFDHVFVAPQKAAARRAELNKKLAATGKPPLGPDGKPIKSPTP
jgi:hypothetical protein